MVKRRGVGVVAAAAAVEDGGSREWRTRPDVAGKILGEGLVGVWFFENQTEGFASCCTMKVCAPSTIAAYQFFTQIIHQTQI